MGLWDYLEDAADIVEDVLEDAGLENEADIADIVGDIAETVNDLFGDD